MLDTTGVFGVILSLFKQDVQRVKRTVEPLTSNLLDLKLGIWRTVVRLVTLLPTPRGTILALMYDFEHKSQILDIARRLNHINALLTTAVQY